MVRLPQNFINVHRWLQREINRHEQLYELPLSIEEINLIYIENYEEIIKLFFKKK